MGIKIGERSVSIQNLCEDAWALFNKWQAVIEGASQVALVVKNLPANAGNLGASSIPGSRRSLGGRHGNPLQYSSLENSMDRGAWQTIVHAVTKSWT